MVWTTAESRVSLQLYALTPETFATEIAPARTFCLEEEAEALAGWFGATSSRRGHVGFGADGPIATELRFPEEPARTRSWI